MSLIIADDWLTDWNMTDWSKKYWLIKLLIKLLLNQFDYQNGYVDYYKLFSQTIIRSKKVKFLSLCV